MKEGIHPDYHAIKVVLTDGTEYTNYTTWGKEGDVMRLDIDPLNHPAWNGGNRQVVERGQLSKFEKKFGGFMAATPTNNKAEEEKK